MELFVKQRRIRPSSSWCWEHLFAAQMRTHKQTCSDHAWFVAVKTAFSPLLKKNACLVWEKICERTYWTPRRPSSDSDVIVGQCAFPHCLFFHSITPAPPLPSGPVLASVPMLHGLSSKSKDAGQSTRPKHQPTGAVTAIHHPLLRPHPQKPNPCDSLRPITPHAASCLLLPFAWVTTRPAVAEGVIHHTPVCADAQGFSSVLKWLPSLA